MKAQTLLDLGGMRDTYIICMIPFDFVVSVLEVLCLLFSKLDTIMWHPTWLHRDKNHERFPSFLRLDCTSIGM